MPYVFDLSRVELDYLLAFCFGILWAVTINAEAQAFVAQILGDVREKDNNRFHFNAFLHLDVLGTIAFFVAGLGWPRKVDIDPKRFEHPRAYTVMVRFAGPVANFLLAGIVSSICLIIEQFSIDAEMFQIVLGVNLMVALANILPLAPLAGWSVPLALIPDRYSELKDAACRFGPYLLVAFLVAERLGKLGIMDRLFSPLYRPLYQFMTKTYLFG